MNVQNKEHVKRDKYKKTVIYGNSDLEIGVALSALAGDKPSDRCVVGSADWYDRR